jgi:nicotinate-nucleotide pyrophosphorylase (carboxylating)
MDTWQLNQIDQTLIELALTEDLGAPFCDLTTQALFPDNNKISRARIISKHSEPIVLCGLPVIKAVLNKFTDQSQIQESYQDGQIVNPKETILTIEAPANYLLMAERTILNFLQRLCAVATLTKKFVDAVKHTSLKILDTRKTTPGYRHLEKYAVQCGGGVNHRMGLYDAMMIKDTHVDALGGMEQALMMLAKNTGDRRSPLPNTNTIVGATGGRPLPYNIIVEVRNIEELKIVLQYGRNKITRVLLDNMSPELMRECVALCKNIFPTEASGNISLDNIKTIAETGVDFASIGKLTHSAGSVDLSMKTAI